MPVVAARRKRPSIRSPQAYCERRAPFTRLHPCFHSAVLRIRRTRELPIPRRTTFLVKKCLYAQETLGAIPRSRQSNWTEKTLHWRGYDNANRKIAWTIAVHRGDPRHTYSIQCTNGDRRMCPNRPSRATGVCPAGLPRAELHLDARILGVWRRRLLLGARKMGDGAGTRFPVDSWLLGICRRCVRLAWGLLGTTRRLLWWD